MTLADLFQTSMRLVSQPPLMRGNYDQGARLIKEKEGHIRRDHQCGICGYTFRPLERCFALIGDQSGMKYAGNTKPFPFTNSIDRHDFTVGGLPGWSVCQAGYQDHKQAPCDSAMVHTECFELFRKRCKHPDALNRLFRFTAWRKPWPQIPNLSLREARTVVSLPSVAAMSEAYGLRNLSELPIEILFTIWNNCPDALLWRYVLIMGIAEQLSAAEQYPTEKVALADILSWTRGSALVTSPGSDPGSKTLVTLDSRGIRSVDRLSSGRKSRYQQSESHRYLVIRSPEPGIIATCTEDLMRLEIDAPHPDFFIADTPNIHDLPIPRSPLSPAPQSLTDQYCTINLPDMTGLTLFFEKGHRLVSIFGHTKQRPYAMAPTELMSDSDVELLLWRYVPLPEGEKILSLSRGYAFYDTSDPPSESDATSSAQDEEPTAPSFYLDTELAGPVGIGREEFKKRPDVKQMLADHPKLFIFKKRSWAYQEHYLDEPHIVGYPNILQSTLDEGLSATPRLPVLNSILHTITIAPLDDVVSATVFNPPGGKWCRGILLTYKSGAQRSLGQCRFGHYTAVTVAEPRFVEIEHIIRSNSTAYIEQDMCLHDSWFERVVRFYDADSKERDKPVLLAIENKCIRWLGVGWRNTSVKILDAAN